MKSPYLFIIVFLTLINSSFVNAQLGASSVLQLQNVSNAEMLAIVSPNTGSLVYNTSDEGVYKFNGTNWVRADVKNSLKTLVLDRTGGYTLATTNNTYFDFPLNATHVQTIDSDTFEVTGDGTIRILADGVYMISAELSTSNMPAGTTKYIIAAFLNGTANPGDIMGYLNRGFVTLPSQDWWGATGVLMYTLSQNDIIRLRYVLNAGGANLTGRFINIGITKVK